MKLIALILLLFFAAVQVIPGVQSIFKESKGLVFNVDEEKNTEKTAPEEKKEKKDFQLYPGQNRDHSHKMRIAFLESEKIRPYPLLEKLIPPPNFS